MVASPAKSKLLPELHLRPKFANLAKKHRTTYTTTTSALEYEPESEVVYDRLVSEGEHFAEGEMDALLTHLGDKEQIIRGPVLYFDREERAKHGAMTITGIAGWLC